mgnify:CR=1 FL=1
MRFDAKEFGGRIRDLRKKAESSFSMPKSVVE